MTIRMKPAPAAASAQPAPRATTAPAPPPTMYERLATGAKQILAAAGVVVQERARVGNILVDLSFQGRTHGSPRKFGVQIRNWQPDHSWEEWTRHAQDEARLIERSTEGTTGRVLVDGTGQVPLPLVTLDGLSEQAEIWSGGGSPPEPPNDAQRNIVFVAMPFHRDYLDVFEQAMLPAAKAHGLILDRVDMTHTLRGITDRIIAGIERSRFVLADVSQLNPNVMYELGMARGFSRGAFLIHESQTKLPFDIKDVMALTYDRAQLPALTAELTRRLGDVLRELGVEAGASAKARSASSLIGGDSSFAPRLLEAARAREIDTTKSAISAWIAAQSSYEMLTGALLSLSNVMRGLGSGDSTTALYANVLSLMPPREVLDVRAVEFDQDKFQTIGAHLQAFAVAQPSGDVQIEAGDHRAMRSLLIASHLGLVSGDVKVRMGDWNTAVDRLARCSTSVELSLYESFGRPVPTLRAIGGVSNAITWIAGLRVTPHDVERLKEHPLFASYPSAFFDYLMPPLTAGGARVSGGRSAFEDDLRKLTVEALPDGEMYVGGPIMRVSGPPTAVEIIEPTLACLVASGTTVATVALGSMSQVYGAPVPMHPARFSDYGAGEEAASAPRPDLLRRSVQLSFPADAGGGEDVFVRLSSSLTVGPECELFVKIGVDGKIDQWVIGSRTEVDLAGGKVQRLMRSMLENGAVKIVTSHKQSIAFMARRLGLVSDAVKTGAKASLGMTSRYKQEWWDIARRLDATQETAIAAILDETWPTVEI